MATQGCHRRKLKPSAPLVHPTFLATPVSIADFFIPATTTVKTDQNKRKRAFDELENATGPIFRTNFERALRRKVQPTTRPAFKTILYSKHVNKRSTLDPRSSRNWRRTPTSPGLL